MTITAGSRTRLETAWSGLAVICAAVAAAAALTLAVAAVATATGPGPTPWKLVLLPAVWVVPGLLVAVGRPSNPLGWLMLGIAVAFAVSAFATEWLGAGGRTGAAWAVWFVDRASAIVVPAGLLTLLLLPSGRLPSRRWRPVAAAAVAIPLLSVVAWSLASGPAAAPDTELPTDVTGLANPVGVLPASWTGPLAGLDLWLLQAPLLLGVVVVIRRLRRHDRDERERLVGVLAAGALFAVLAVVGRQLWPSAADALDVAGSVMLAGALCSAVIRRRLSGVDTVVHYALVYTILTVAVAALYVLAVAALGQSGRSLSPFGAGLVTACVALALLPARSRLQRLVDRVMYGDTRTRGRTALRFINTVDGSSSVTSVVSGLASAATASLRSTWVSIVVGEVRVEQGSRPDQGAIRTAPLLADDEVIGTLTVALSPYRGFGDREEAALAELARHGGRALRAARLADDLLASREQLITAREEERLRLRRDLHDELGPTMASLAMQLGGLAPLIAADPATAIARVNHLEGAARGALEQVRETARGLRPPTLDELGLVGALRQVAADLGVRVQATGDAARLVPAVEVAAFRIGAEALTNVARHSGQTNADLTVTLDGSDLLLRVVDEGRGSGGAPVGVGMLAMRERAEELGGALTIGGTPGGGTTVEARIPRAIRAGVRP